MGALSVGCETPIPEHCRLMSEQGQVQPPRLGQGSFKGSEHGAGLQVKFTNKKASQGPELISLTQNKLP